MRSWGGAADCISFAYNPAGWGRGGRAVLMQTAHLRLTWGQHSVHTGLGIINQTKPNHTVVPENEVKLPAG